VRLHLDLEFGADRIDLAFVDVDQELEGNQAFTFIGWERLHDVAGELRSERS
jgi:hypothetical protein